jgi:signal transduction histidine kinase
MPPQLPRARRAEFGADSARRAELGAGTEPAARGASPDDVFTAVVDAASALLDGLPTHLVRFEDDGTSLVLAVRGAGTPAGARAPAEGDSLAARVRQSGQAVRIDDFAAIDVRGVRAGWGVRAAVAVPVTGAGGAWGLLAATSADGPLPDDTEQKLARFTDVVAAAVAAAQSWNRLQALVEEQAALRRLAELAAREAPVSEVLDAVAHEASWLAGVSFGMVLRFEPDGSTQIEALSGAPENFEVGMRSSAQGDGSAYRVWRTGRAARVDDLGAMSGQWPRMAARFGFKSSAAAPMRIEESLWGALVVVARHAPLPPGIEDHLSNFSELAGTAIAAAENRAKLTASRARVVATGDESRRRLQRDVHDSAQQRLVHTIVALKLARDALAEGRDPAALVDEALRNAERANRDLRDVVRGILPAALSRGGLAAGLESLVEDLTVPVRLHVTAPRLTPALETTAYFVVAEALTNVVKHARASHAEVTVRLDVRIDGATLVLDVRDDGVGDADPARGTGLVGLLDRVEAGGGTLVLTSPPGVGTTIRVELPVGTAPA